MNIEELLAAVREDFLTNLPSREAAIVDAVRVRDLEAAKRCCHQLRGTAGSFQEFAVGEAAGAIEDAIDALPSGPELERELEPLVAALLAAVAEALT